MRRAWQVLTLLLLASACACRSGTTAPERPARVPSAALWLGGPDGGAWVLLEKRAADPRDMYQAKVFHQNGDVWHAGPLLLDPPGATPVEIGKVEQFSGWDGNAVHMLDGRSLRVRKN